MEISRAIWDSLLDADLSVKYWRALSIRYSNINKVVKIFLAVITSGTVASWGFWVEVAILWKILSGIAATVAIVLPILNYEEKIKNTSLLVGKWIEVREEYEILYSTMTNKAQSELESEFKRIKNKEIEVSKKEEDLPVINGLRIKCYKEVLRSRGLKSPKKELLQ